MVTVKFGSKSYELHIDEQLKTLTGTESMMVEDYLGGWARFRAPENATRSTIVIVWLAMREAGEQKTLEEIADTPGLMFGDVFDLMDDDGEGEPVDPMVKPDRPLADRNGSNGSTDGTTGSGDGPVRSDGTGQPLSVVSTA